MEEQRQSIIEQIPPEDWEKTPASVKKLVELMAQRIESLEQQAIELLSGQQQLIEKVNKTSKNSSSPPSSDPPGFGQKTPKKSGKKRGGQPGHEGRGRNLYPVEKCHEVIDHHPVTCPCCGESLKGEDTIPYRHQIVEIPPIEPIVIEHRLHQLTCSRCGTSTRAKLPDNVSPSGYGVRTVATVAILSGLYRNSHRMVQSALADLFGISMSLGTVNKLRLEASNAVADCVDEAKAYIQQQEIVEGGMWLFVTTPGVEPTNNAAERAIRPAVIWRRTSFGTQTKAGSTFVARMLTVVTTLKSQQRNILEFITTAVTNAREGQSAPSLLPEVECS